MAVKTFARLHGRRTVLYAEFFGWSQCLSGLGASSIVLRAAPVDSSPRRTRPRPRSGFDSSSLERTEGVTPAAERMFAIDVVPSSSVSANRKSSQADKGRRPQGFSSRASCGRHLSLVITSRSWMSELNGSNKSLERRDFRHVVFCSDCRGCRIAVKMRLLILFRILFSI